MHEVGLTQSILDMAEIRALEAGAKSIGKITICVGRISGAVPEALEFSFEALTPGTMAEGAELEIERVDVACRCAECDIEFTPQEMIYSCPQCGTPSSEIIRGRELYLVSMEVD